MTEAALVLDDVSREIIEREVARGRYDDAGQVVRSALLLLTERDAAYAELRTALIEGETSGEATPFDFAAYLAGKEPPARA